MAELDKPGALFEKFFDNPARRASAKKADETYGSDLIGEYDRIKQSRERLNYLTTERANTLANLPNISPPKPSITSDLMGGNAMTGPDPERKADQFSNLEYTKQLASKTQDIADSNQNPYAWAKPYTFNTGINNADFDRYYTHPLYNELGYSPFRDNEALYNEKATWTDDFNRMRKQWLGLALEGVKSMWGSADSEDFERRNKIAQSSRGGVGGFTNNLLLNSSYTIGVATDLIVEELALSAGIAATGGLASEVMIPQMAASAARAAKLLGTSKTFSQTRDMLNIMKGAKARTFFNETKAAKTAGNIADYLNPLRYSTRAAYGLATGAKGYKGLTALAQVSTGTGAFLRDMVRLRAAYGESKLEGDGLQIRYTNDLIGEYYAEHGKMPEGQDAEKLYSLAREVNFKSQLYNMPLLLVTNDMVFGKAFRGFSPRWLARAEASGKMPLTVAKEANWKKLGVKPLEVLPSGYKKFLVKNYWKQSPTKIALGALNYGKANFFEGAQETMQEVISNGIERYYTNIYHDPLLTGSQQYWAAMNHGAASQLNGQGFETFLSGFLMGGVLQVPQNLIVSAKERFAKNASTIKKNREDLTTKIVDSMNEVIMRTGKFSSAIEENMINQKNLANQMRDSENRNDRKGYQDAKNSSIFGHVRTLLEHDQYDVFMDSLNEMTEWSDAELAEAFNTTEDADTNNKSVRERLNSVIEEAENVKEIYENFSDQFADPSDVHKYNKKEQPDEWLREVLKRQAFNDVKYHTAFGFYTFKKTQSRMTSIINDVGGAKMPLKDVSSDDVTSLFDSQQRGDKIKSLVDEVKSYENATPAEKKRGKKLEAQLKDYDALAEAISVYEHLFDEAKAPLIGPRSELDTALLANEATISDNLKKAYFKYIKTLAKNNDVVMLDEEVYPSLNGLMDYLQLSKESKALAESINFLHDPDNFITTTIRQGEFLQKIYEKEAEIVRGNLEKFEKYTGENKLIFNNLFDLGVWLPEESVKAFKEERDSEIVFYHVNNPEGRVDPIKDKELYDKALALIADHRQLNPTVTPVTAESVASKIINEEELTLEEEDFRDDNPTAMATALAKVKPKAKPVDDAEKIMFTNATPISDMDPNLVTALTEAHADWNAKADTEDQVTLEHYIKNFEAAELVIVAYNSKVGRTIAPTKKVPPLPPIVSGKPNVTETVNLEEKKQEAIKNIVKDDSKVDYDVPVIHRADPIWHTTVDGKDIEASSKEDLLKKIDEALGIVPIVPQPSIVRGVVKKLKPEFKGKIIYGTPGIGKTTSVAHNPDLIDGDNLLLKYLNLLEEEEGQALTKPTDDIGAALFEVPQDYDDGYSKLDAIYDKAVKEAEALATAGKTVLFGSSRLVSDLALLKGRGIAVFSTTNDRMVGKGLSEEGMIKVRNNEAIGRKVAEVHPDFKVYTSDNISDLIFEEEAPGTPKEERSVLDDINEASTIEEINEIADKVDNTDAGYFVRRNIDHTNVLKKIEEKRIEIAGSVIIAKLKKGQEFLMKDLKFYGKKGWGVVTKVTRTNVSIAKKGDPGKVTIYKKSELNDKVWQQITLEMKPIQQQKIEFDEQTEKLSDESVKENKEMTAEQKKEIIAKAKNTPMEDLKKNMFKKRC